MMSDTLTCGGQEGVERQKYLLNNSQHLLNMYHQGFLGGSVAKNLPANAGEPGNMGLIPGQGRSLGGGNGNTFQYSCLENPMDRGVWQAIAQGVTKQSDVTEHTCIICQAFLYTLYVLTHLSSILSYERCLLGYTEMNTSKQGNSTYLLTNKKV